jgi:hypothetical protein
MGIQNNTAIAADRIPMEKMPMLLRQIAAMVELKENMIE